MAMTHSSSSSGESLSDYRSSLFSPVQPATPTLPASQPHTPSRSNSSPPKTSMPGDLAFVSTSSPSTSSNRAAAAASVPGLLSPPPPLLHVVPGIAPQAPFSIPTLLSKSMHQGLSLIGSSSSSMLGRIQLPLQVPTSSIPPQQSTISTSLLPQLLSPPRPMVAQQPTTNPSHPAMLISGPINQIELEMLKDLQKKITERLHATQATVVPSDEGMDEQGRLSMATRLMEWKGPTVVDFTHCVAGKPEKLEQVPFHYERMRHLLAQHEIKIQCIDRRPPSQPPPLITPRSIMTSVAAVTSTTSIPMENRTAQQVSLTREPFLLQNRRVPYALTASSSVSPSSSSSGHTVPPIASAPSPSIAATPTTSTVASCPFTLPTSVTPTTPNPTILTLPSPFASMVAPMAMGQTPVSGALAGSMPGHIQSPLVPVLLPQQAIGFLPSAQSSGGSYCVLPSPFQQSPQLSVSGIVSPPVVSSASTAVANLPQQIQQNAPSLISGLPTGGILLNNMALTAGGINTPMYVVMPAYPTVFPTAPQAVPQAAAASPSSTPVLQVARSASVMLDHQRAMQQHLNQIMFRSQEAAAAANSRPPVTTEIAVRLGKRVRPMDLPDSMGERILKVENPAAASSSSSPSKYSSVAANQNHPRWPLDKPGVSGSRMAEVGLSASSGHRTMSSSDSDQSSKISED